MITIDSHSEEQTKQVAAQIAKELKAGDIVCLYGDLGAGKTTFVKGISDFFKIDETQVVSPTYVLQNIYDGTLEIYHFDLYRLGNMAQINTLGYEEYFYGDGVSFIEWPERLGDAMPDEYLKVELLHRDQGRTITVTAVGKRYENIVEGLKEVSFKR